MYSGQYREYVLSQDVNSFLFEKLDYPRTMSKLVKMHKNVVNGKKITYLPLTAEDETMMYFHRSFDISEDPARDWVVFKITEFLNIQENNIILFQNPDFRPDAPWIRKKDFQKYLHSLNDECLF